MILTVTLNVALDVTYAVDALVPGEAHRVRSVTERPGGKGLNVARVLGILGEPVVATGFAGGAAGRRVQELLTVPHAFAEIGAESRRTVVVSDGASGTGFWEPGPVVTGAEWEGFVARYTGLVSAARVVVLSGSLPGGVPEDAYATLIRIAEEHGVPSILDSSRAALVKGLAAGPAVAKPNAEELAELAPGLGVVEAARAAGSGVVFASRGADGMLAVTGDRAWRAVPPSLSGNPTGAGDAGVAAIARGLAYQEKWSLILQDAVALSAAAVLAPEAGAVALPDYERIRRAVTVEEL
ncbi:1-phosphofructokinase family hexose kinase [Longispora albida]|uniref:1-phosphofructokinase family hexose kinase n=1 Tax=Longispora albida TaxID=203523 RepID=UPI000376FDA1|nr:hexose kinase [Longispora albida]